MTYSVGGVVSINAKGNQVIYNEINKDIFKLLELFKELDSEQIIRHINSKIDEYKLPTISYNVKSNRYKEEMKNKYNKNYLVFREVYNKFEKNYLDLYTLTFFSFCHLIRLNKNNQFNTSFGNGYFSEKHKEQIRIACERLKTKNIIFKNLDYLDVINIDNLNENDFVYCDPPYLNTTAIYNEKRAYGGWNIENDYELFNLLEQLDKKGIKWGLSNVFENKGIRNEHLVEWCKKNNWQVHHLNYSYTALGKGNANSDEVYICNYKKGE